MSYGIFAGWVVDHRDYVAAHDALSQEIDFALDGQAPFFQMLLGPSGMGKSELLKDLAAQYAPPEGSGERPSVLWIPIRTGSSADDLARTVIQATLGLATVRERKAALRERARLTLMSAGAKVVLLDEGNHSTEARASRHTQTKLNRQIADWLKELLELSGISVVVAGLVHAERMLTDNEQLQSRANRSVELLPYAWYKPEDRQVFADLINQFAGHVRMKGYTLEMDEGLMVKAIYLSSGGLIRPVVRLFERAVLLRQSTRQLDLGVFAQAFEQCSTSHLDDPFRASKISDEMLNTAHRMALELGAVHGKRQPRNLGQGAMHG
ncbi:MAG: TniB family NTP-binding protein [Leptothrix sp. (in: b-proteobacteria)]